MRSTPGARTATTASSPRATTTARRSRTRGTGCAATAAATACAHPDTRVMSKRWESCFPHLREPLLYMRLRLRWRPRRKRGRVPVPPGSAPRQLRHLRAELVDRTARRVDRTGRRMSAENHKRRAETNLGSSRSQLGSLPPTEKTLGAKILVAHAAEVKTWNRRGPTAGLRQTIRPQELLEKRNDRDSIARTASAQRRDSVTYLGARRRRWTVCREAVLFWSSSMISLTRKATWGRCVPVTITAHVPRAHVARWDPTRCTRLMLSCSARRRRGFLLELSRR